MNYSSDADDFVKDSEDSDNETFSTTINRSDLERTGYIMPYNSDSEIGTDAESVVSIESSPSAYKDDKVWNGYKIKKRFKIGHVCSSSDDNAEDESE